MKEYSILTRTDFFGILNGETELASACMHKAYHDFVEHIIECCMGRRAVDNVHVALAFAEIELRFLIDIVEEEMRIHAKKAIAFIRKMMQLASQHHSEVPPLTSNIHPTHITAAKSETPKSLQWTGNTLDLVELIYGLSEMGCIDNGETPLKVLAPALYEFFGLDTKECYRYYSAIKLRKNPSRTYFIDKMQKKLNDKIRRDEELERMRR